MLGRLSRIAAMMFAFIGLSVSLRLLAQEKSPAASLADKSPAAKNSEINFRDRLDAYCIDGSVIRFNLLDAKVPLKTDYGTIEIAASDIRRIEFATRLPTAISERIKSAITKLGDNDYDAREAASADLLTLGHVAYPAVMAACQGTDPEVANRAEILAVTIRKSATGDDLEFQDFDLICTDKSQIAGVIQLESLSVDTTPLGKQQIKLNVLRRVDSGTDVPQNVIADPGNLVNYQNQVGKTIYFRVTAQPQQFRNGVVWGTDTYTLDTTLALAAIHAGLLQPGQTKIVGVTILGPQGSFNGTFRNNIQSQNFGGYPGAFKFKTVPARGFGGVRGQQGIQQPRFVQPMGNF